jgi:hypothetical protein
MRASAPYRSRRLHIVRLPTRAPSLLAIATAFPHPRATRAETGSDMQNSKQEHRLIDALIEVSP